MSQFEGSVTRVRCADCEYLSGKRCSRKDTQVSPKKRRGCALYSFKGSYENRKPLESRYLPPVSKKTRQTIKKLLELGVVPVAEDGGLLYNPSDGTPMVKKTVPMPRSTATATLLKSVPVQGPGYSNQSEDDPLIWTPGGEDEESDSDWS